MGLKKIARQQEYRGSDVSTRTKCLRHEYIQMTGPCEPTLCVLVLSHCCALSSSPVITSLRSHAMYIEHFHYTDQWFRNTGEGTTWRYLFICALLHNILISSDYTMSARNGKLSQTAQQKMGNVGFFQ